MQVNVMKVQILLLLFLFSAFARAETEFRAEAESSEVEEGENVSVSFSVTTTDSNVEVGRPEYSAPDFDEVNMYSAGTSVSQSYINGQFSSQTTENYSAILHPKKKGRLLIRNIKISVGNKTLSAPDVLINVVAQGNLPANRLGSARSGGYTPFQMLRPSPLPRSGVGAGAQNNAQQILIKTEPDKLRVYKGEQIILGYSLYTRAQIGNLQVERYPTASGFLKEDIDIPLLRGKLEWHRAVLNGTEYRRALLASYALFPVQEGKLPLDVFSAKVTFRGGRGSPLSNDEDDVFGLNQFFQAFQMMTESRESDRKTIEVLPLPAEGQPTSFSGLVGEFSVSASVDKTSVKAGDSVTVKFKIEGKGHAGSLESLSVKWPADFEIYEDKSATHYNKDGTSDRIFEYLVIPRVKGSYQIPTVEVSMFNPDTKSYAVKKTEPISIEVLEGIGGSGESRNRATTLSSNRASQFGTDDGLRNVMVSATESGGSFSKIILILSRILAGLAAIYFIFSFGRKMILQSTMRRPQIGKKQLLQRLSQIDVQAHEDPFGAIDVALTEILRVHFGVERGSLIKQELQDELRAKGAKDEAIAVVLSLVETCENQRFLPKALRTGSDSRDQASALIRRMRQLLN